jgi:hypothetical protein
MAKFAAETENDSVFENIHLMTHDQCEALQKLSLIPLYEDPCPFKNDPLMKFCIPFEAVCHVENRIARESKKISFYNRVTVVL